MKTATLVFALFSIPCLAQSSQPIALDPANPHYFSYEGKTIALITDGEHYGSVINPDFDYHVYLKTQQADGLNYTRIFGGSYVEVPAASFGIKRNTLAPAEGRVILPWARSGEAGYAGGGNKFDLSAWNPDYFRRLNDFLTEAAEHGIVVEISLFSSQYGDVQWKFSPFNAANNVNHTAVDDYKQVNTLNNGNVLAIQEQYVRKLVHEANAHPNVIFEIQNEPWSDHPKLTNVINPYLFTGRDQYPNSIEVADDASFAWQARVAQWITSEESGLPNKHLIAQCYSNFLASVRSLVEGASVVNFHYAYPEAASLNYGLNKAIAYDETGFLGRDDDKYRRQAWNFMLAGGSIFDGLDYSFTTDHPDGADTEPNGPGGGSIALRYQLAILQRFIAGLPLAQMSPDSHAVIHAEGVTAHTLSSQRGDYAIYLDGNGPSRVSLRLPAGSYKGERIDTVTGATTAIADFKADGREYVLASPAFTNGIALRLTRKVY
ncbi:MAG TPA: hypothetical protein VGJ21_10570 [Terracidiphilus sp.]|jgi:hypothetical protein